MNVSVNKKILFLTQFAMLTAIEAIVCFTPLGSIPIGPLVATLGMVPVIITAILLGTGAGTAMGFLTGLFSFLVWTFVPPTPVVAFVFTPFYSIGEVRGNFWSLVICFVPRILVGAVTGLCFRAFTRLNWKAPAAYGLSGVLGSLVNTLLVLGGIILFFGQSYAAAFKVSFRVLLGLIGTTIATNGVLEAVIGGIAAYAICYPIKRHVLSRFE